MAKRKKQSGFGGISSETFSKERAKVIDDEPVSQAQSSPKSVDKNDSSAETKAIKDKTRASAGTKPTWKQEGVEYSRMSFYLSKTLKQKIKVAVATRDDFQYQDALVNAALEEFFSKRG